MTTEADALRLALDLAWRGWGRVQPNPLVGAVVLLNGEIVGTGWHPEFGQTHAEAMALREAGDRSRGGTLVVTLEPCRHEGKQPPCTDLIRRAGIKRVVIAAGDPNPLASGGAAELAAEGIEVELAPLDLQVRRQNPAFFRAFTAPELPFIALKLATSVDGAIADQGSHSGWISGTEAREYVHWLRAGFDAIAVGGRTARRDDPALTVRGAVAPRVPPRRIVFSRGGDLTGAVMLQGTARELPVTVIGQGIPERRRHALVEAGIEVLPSDPREGLRTLRRRGVLSVLVEGGGELASRLLDAGLIDRFYWIQCPLWLGIGGVPAFGGLRGSPLADAERWHVVERRPLGEDTLLVLER